MDGRQKKKMMFEYPKIYNLPLNKLTSFVRGAASVGDICYCRDGEWMYMFFCNENNIGSAAPPASWIRFKNVDLRKGS